MNGMRPVRQPRSAARRAQVHAQIGGQLKSPPLARPAFTPAGAWEDTGAIIEAPPQKTFWGRQPPITWILMAVVLIAMFLMALAAGINAWRVYELERAEARRLRQWAEEKAKYKFPYRGMIEDYASEAGVDPALVAAVIYHESRFDPSAVSSVGARGLMQIMENTGVWIAERLHEKDNYTPDSLFNAETSIRFGAWYLGFLSRMFDGDIVKITAGYHAGQNAVQGWLRDPAYSADGVTLDTIPYASTEQYVNRVVNAYAIYIKHYYAQEEVPTPAGGAS
ncbi:MAG: lytic transglycosylase domain-containing protein [Firmicutes bacterium]|nr:lytic transglycosylase domain-containing protein [Bacillota bacterium]